MQLNHHDDKSLWQGHGNVHHPWVSPIIKHETKVIMMNLNIHGLRFLHHHMYETSHYLT